MLALHKYPNITFNYQFIVSNYNNTGPLSTLFNTALVTYLLSSLAVR